MIKNILLPEHINNYYLFKKRIIGLDIGRSYIIASEILLSGNKKTIITCKEFTIEPNGEETYKERAAQTLKTVFTEFTKYDAIHIALPSSLVIFKELKLPFTSYDKIKMVINFEVEPMLPFSIHDAVVDFIITKTNMDEKTSEIFVAAVQKNHIFELLELCKDAGISPNKICVDLIDLYGLFQELPIEKENMNGIALVDIGTYTTQIAYIYKQQLRAIRSLPYGTSNIVKSIASSMQIQPQQAYDLFYRFGFTKGPSSEYTTALEAAVNKYVQKLLLTFTSFDVYHAQQEKTEKLWLFGQGAELKNIDSFLAEKLMCTTGLLNSIPLAQAPHVVIESKNSITSASVISVATALSSPMTKDFNLLSDEYQPSQSVLLLKQLAAITFLTLALFGSFLTFSIFQKNKLKQELQISEEEAVEVLKRRFKSISKDKDELSEVISAAQREINREQETWFAFSKAARSRFLEYLLELTNKIDKDSLGFVAEQITIAEGQIVLKARVKDHEALPLLERSLRSSPLFSYVEPQNDTNFTMKITLSRNTEGSS